MDRFLDYWVLESEKINYDYEVKYYILLICYFGVIDVGFSLFECIN